MTGSWLRTLGNQIAEEQDARLSRQDLTPVGRRILQSHPTLRARTQDHRLAWALGAAALVAGIGIATVTLYPRRPIEFQIEQAGYSGPVSGGIGTWVSAPDFATVPIRFSDGTRVTLQARARARIARIDQDGVGIVVERGRLDISVVHQAKMQYSLATGPFAVTVTGTELSLDWQPEGELLEVAVRKGSVLLSGCQFSQGRPVVANEILRARCGDTVSVTTTGRGDPNALPPASTPTPRGSVEPEAVAVHSSSKDGPSSKEAVPETIESAAAPRWQALALKGQYRAAYELAVKTGFENECARLSASELTLLVDVARYAGKLGRAEYAARTVRSRFAGKPEASLASFTLGRIAFDAASDYAEAARWFRTYLGEQPGGALAREAQGRLMESLSRSGQRAEASQAARQYLRQYPEGPHARVARQMVKSSP